MMTGVKTHHVPYKGGGPALTDLVRGEVQMHFAVIVSALPHIRSGRLKPLAIGGESRFATLPQVPTFTEAGLPGFDLRPWQGMLAPAATPRPIVDRLSGEIGRIVALPDIREKLVGSGHGAARLDPRAVRRAASGGHGEGGEGDQGREHPAGLKPGPWCSPPWAKRAESQPSSSGDAAIKR